MGTNNELNVRKYCRYMKIQRIILLVVLVLFLVPWITHYYLSTVERNSFQITHSAHSHADLPEDLSPLRGGDLQGRIEELLRIKGSVSSELREMEHKRQQLLADIQLFTKHIDQSKIDLYHQQTELTRLKISIEQAQVAQREALEQNTPELALPKRFVPNQLPPVLPAVSRQQARSCRMFSCFDHSRCSITSGFPVYLYDPDEYPVIHYGWDIDGFLKTTLKQALGYNAHFTNNPREACIFLVLVGEALRDSDDISDHVSGLINVPSLDSKTLKRLPYWGGDGRNHVLLNLARRDLSSNLGDIFSVIDTGWFTIVIILILSS